MPENKKLKGTISANGLSVRTILSSDGDDYISLTDLAKFKNKESPADIIKNWMRVRNTVEYLGLWEQIHNQTFKLVEFERLKNEAGTNAFVLSPQKWIKETNAIGIQSSSGRYGGTYAHSDIAFKFAAWLSPEFELYVVKDYQRLKKQESNHLSLEWNAKRELAKTNYKIHTDAIKEYLISPELPPEYRRMTYASEADVINIALFGMTAKDWRAAHPELGGNIRDYANVYQLIVLTNLESINAVFIKSNMPQQERMLKLREIAASQLKSISTAASAKRIEQSVMDAQKDGK